MHTPKLLLSFLIPHLLTNLHHALERRLQLRGIAEAGAEGFAYVERHKIGAEEVPIFSFRRPPGLTRWGNRVWQMERIHAPAGQRLGRVFHQPRTIARVG